MTYKVVHYINQFFAGIGGEEKADIAPEVREGIVGPGMALNNFFKKEDAEIVATVICGDSYFAENMDSASDFVVEAVKKFGADGFVAGPAFNAGRYGTACGAVCKAVGEKLGIPTVSPCTWRTPASTCTRSTPTSFPRLTAPAAWARPSRRWSASSSAR